MKPTELIFKNLTDNSLKTIQCKKWYPTKTGVLYITDSGEHFEFDCVHSDFIFWNVQ